jgi:hypothetical protein
VLDYDDETGYPLDPDTGKPTTFQGLVDAGHDPGVIVDDYVQGRLKPERELADRLFDTLEDDPDVDLARPHSIDPTSPAGRATADAYFRLRWTTSQLSHAVAVAQQSGWRANTDRGERALFELAAAVDLMLGITLFMPPMLFEGEAEQVAAR